MQLIVPWLGLVEGTGTGIHPPGDWCTLLNSMLNIRGMLGPVRSTSKTPILAVGERRARVRASWTVMEDFPTPPFPERTWGGQ